LGNGLESEESNMKIGENVVMYFHCAGMVSEETYLIEDIKGSLLYLDDDNDELRCFNMKTGVCLNDNTFLGAYRTIEIR
jgi:hypothetical protein